MRLGLVCYDVRYVQRVWCEIREHELEEGRLQYCCEVTRIERPSQLFRIQVFSMLNRDSQAGCCIIRRGKRVL